MTRGIYDSAAYYFITFYFIYYAYKTIIFSHELRLSMHSPIKHIYIHIMYVKVASPGRTEKLTQSKAE